MGRRWRRADEAVDSVRDPVTREALQRLAAEAATRFSSLVATGDEIPFDVAEDCGEQSLFYRYVPLTARFVRERERELRSLPSFGPACAAIAAAGVAAPYLEARGVPVPEDADDRAAQMLIAFIAALWDGCAEFSLDRPRLDKALHELDAEARDVHEAEVLIAPVVGLQMPLPKLQLPSGVRVVRADTVDAPLESMRSEGMQRAAWEPQFLALADQSGGPEGSTAAMRQLRELITVMRLFKEGGVGLGPYVFAPTGEERWRRISTGAPGTRPGGYKLSEAEASDLAEFVRGLESRSDPSDSLRWAIARFEMGCERPSAWEGLSDHLLALRAVLEGDGPVGAALAMRAAALMAEPDDRDDARGKIERAFELERALMGGSRLQQEDGDSGTALGLAVWIEDGVRAMLRDAALGTGADLSVAADETLIAAGLEAGEGSSEQRGATAEWEAIPAPIEVAEQRHEAEADQGVDHPPAADAERSTGAENDLRPSEGASVSDSSRAEPGPSEDSDETRVLEPIPEEGEIRVSAWTQIDVQAGEPEAEGEDLELEDEDPDPGEDQETETEMLNRDWLSEVSRDATLEWPATEGERRPDERERIDTPRVRHLFPVPEDADWDVGELEYDRRRAGRGT